jgi:putative ABC transport system permease protein
MSLALHNLLNDRPRLGLSVAGVALAMMLIILLNGLLEGMYRQVSAYLDHAPGSLVVAQTGVSNLLGATSLLPPDTTSAVGRVDGIERAVPILSQFVVLELHGKKQPLYLIGYDPNLGGGPWRLAAGRAPQAIDEIVFDRVLAERHGVRVGDTIDVMGHALTVSGLSDGTTSWMTSFVFVRKDAAEALLGTPGATSFVLVAPSPGVSAEILRDRLGRLPGVEVVPKDGMIANDLKLLARYFSAPLRLMVGIAFLVGALVVGLVIYTATVERQREYGVLKAIGVRPRRLYALVAAQALITAALGTAIGLGLAFVAGWLIAVLRPQFLVAIVPSALIWVSLSGLGMALVAALFPARLVAHLAPADVFRRAV